MKEKLVALVQRHGETAANASGCYRSWSDPPLNERGLWQAQQAAKFISQYPIKHIICSPLLRAFVTADIIDAQLKSKKNCRCGLEIYQHRGLFPWRLGIFTGLPKEEHGDALRLFVDNPEVTIPEGECLQDFEDRQFAFWKATLEQAHEGGLTLYVCHTSNIVSLTNFTEEGSDTNEPEFGDSVKPGGTAAIWWDGKHHRVEPVFGGEEEAKFGGS